MAIIKKNTHSKGTPHLRFKTKQFFKKELLLYLINPMNDFIFIYGPSYLSMNAKMKDKKTGNLI
jgi:hypothetical protein